MPAPTSPVQRLPYGSSDSIRQEIPELYTVKQEFSSNGLIFQAPPKNYAFVYSYRIQTNDAPEIVRFQTDALGKIWTIVLGTSGFPPGVAAELAVTPPGYLFMIQPEGKFNFEKSGGKPFVVEVGYYVLSSL